MNLFIVNLFKKFIDSIIIITLKMAEGSLFNIGNVKFMCELLFYVMYSFM